MAIPSYLTTTIQTSGASPDTFGSWISKNNALFQDMGTVVVTTDSTANGATTTGNTHINGILSGSTLVAGTGIRGGSVSSSGTLNVLSSVAVSPSVASTFTINGSTDVTASGNFSINGGAKTFTVSTSATNLSSTTTNVSGTLNTTGTVNASGTVNLNGTTNVNDAVIDTLEATDVSLTNLTTTGTVHFNSVTAIEIPAGTTAQRPTGVAGMVRFNSSLNRFEGYNNSSVWANIGGGASTSGTAPTSPLEGDLWYDTTLKVLKVREGQSWFQVTPITYTSTTATLSKALNLTGNLSVDGAIVATGDITAFSDQRLKENVVTIDGALDKVVSMRGVYYNRIGDAERKIGVIAQEVEKVAPELVMEQENGLKSVAYANALGLIIEAIRELKMEIEELKRG